MTPRLDYCAASPDSPSGSVFAYVTEGEVISQLKGQAPKRYKAGRIWRFGEMPNTDPGLHPGYALPRPDRASLGISPIRSWARATKAAACS
ncbi:cupin domain-containing protein [Metapseudomonas resinovorans]|uniref:hypothetical protein n=1 Tax=Metapseudomonas resinovorans TaxID=53412 RepID=UPI001B7FD3DF|nr:hypothetical protein [Pseudomonas resinovorans]